MRSGPRAEGAFGDVAPLPTVSLISWCLLPDSSAPMLGPSPMPCGPSSCCAGHWKIELLRLLRLGSSDVFCLNTVGDHLSITGAAIPERMFTPVTCSVTLFCDAPACTGAPAPGTYSETCSACTCAAAAPAAAPAPGTCSRAILSSRFWAVVPRKRQLVSFADSAALLGDIACVKICHCAVSIHTG